MRFWIIQVDNNTVFFVKERICSLNPVLQGFGFILLGQSLKIFKYRKDVSVIYKYSYL